MSILEEHSDFLKVILSQSDDDEGSEKFSESTSVMIKIYNNNPCGGHDKLLLIIFNLLIRSQGEM